MTNPQILTLSNAEEFFGTRPSNVPEFRRVRDIPKAEGETFLIYGGSGTGKTWFAGTAGDRTLLINNGNGFSTLQSPKFQESIKANPLIVTLNERMGPRGTVSDAEVHDAICDTLDHALQTFPELFDTVVIDDVTQLRRGAMNKGLELNGLLKKSQTKANVVDKYDVVSPAVQDYQMEMTIIEQFIANYTTICKKAGKHLIFNAHERQTFVKGERIGDTPILVKTSPGFTGQTFPDQIPGYFDNVWYFQVLGGGDQRVYRITTQGHEKLTAKTRMGGVFPTTMDNTTFLQVIEKIRNTTKPIIKK